MSPFYKGNIACIQPKAPGETSPSTLSPAAARVVFTQSTSIAREQEARCSETGYNASHDPIRPDEFHSRPVLEATVRNVDACSARKAGTYTFTQAQTWVHTTQLSMPAFEHQTKPHLNDTARKTTPTDWRTSTTKIKTTSKATACHAALFESNTRRGTVSQALTG